jgi:hypothetical protein
MSSKYRVVVLKIVAGEISVTAAALEYGLSGSTCTSSSPGIATKGSTV